MQKEKKESSFFNIITKMNANVTPAARSQIAPLKEKAKAPANDTHEVSVERIMPTLGQPRKVFNQASLSELAASIKEHGIIQPIIVYKKSDKYIIIAGERRYRAALSIGLQKVPVIIRNVTEKEKRELSLIENLHREDLNPIEEAEAIYSLIEEFGLTQEEVAKTLGKSRPAVTNTLRLLRLSDYIKDMIKDGKLTAGHARVLLSLKNADLQLKYAKEAYAKRMSVHELERTINKTVFCEKTKIKPQPKISRELKAMESDMQRIFATKVLIIGDEQKGKIQINYFSKDELQKIYEVIEEIKEN